MNRRDCTVALLALAATPRVGMAQQVRVHRVGIVLQGGAYAAGIDGLRDGLRELGWLEGKQFVLLVRDSKGDLAAVEAAARALEDEKVDLIFTLATSVTLAARRATRHVPIVFYAGTDPVAAGLVANFQKPGGRLTGIHTQNTDLTAKRLQLLREMVPGLRRVATFYNPGNVASQQSIRLAREAARQLDVRLVERPVSSVEQLREAVRALGPKDADAILQVSDSMVSSQPDLLIETARERRLPTMFQFNDSVAKGALASYGVSYYDLGRLSAKQIQRILMGTAPGDLPVEQVDRFRFVVNLKTAEALGLAIPRSVLARVDEVIR